MEENQKKSSGSAMKIVVIILVVLVIISAVGYLGIRWLFGKAGDHVARFVDEVEIEEWVEKRMGDIDFYEEGLDVRTEAGMPTEVSGEEITLPLFPGSVMYSYEDVENFGAMIRYAVPAPFEQVKNFYENELRNWDEEFYHSEGAYGDGLYTFETELAECIITLDYYRNDQNKTDVAMIVPNKYIKR